MRRGRRPARGCPGWRSAPSSELMRRRRRPTTGPDDGFARARASARPDPWPRLVVSRCSSTLHSKLTPWVVLDETYLGAYGRVRCQYQISEPTAGESAPRRLTPWPNPPTPRLMPSTPCAPWPTRPSTRSSTRGRRRRREERLTNYCVTHPEFREQRLHKSPDPVLWTAVLGPRDAPHSIDLAV